MITHCTVDVQYDEQSWVAAALRQVLRCAPRCVLQGGPCPSSPCRFRRVLGSRKDTPITCILFRSDKFTPLSAIVSIHFSPWPLFFGTDYQLISFRFQFWTPLNQEPVRSITPFHK